MIIQYTIEQFFVNRYFYCHTCKLYYSLNQFDILIIRKKIQKVSLLNVAFESHTKFYKYNKVEMKFHHPKKMRNYKCLTLYGQIW